MLVIVGAIVWLAALDGVLEFVGKCGSPFLPGEVALLRQRHGEREGLRLPRLVYSPTVTMIGKLAEVIEVEPAALLERPAKDRR